MKEIKQKNGNSIPVNPIVPVSPYIGGKRILSKRLITLIESVPHDSYAEPFIGMGGVFFRRRFRPKSEFINDISKDISNLFRILQRHYVPFMDMLKYQLTTRTDFYRLRSTNPDTLTDLERAARFLYIQRIAFGGRYSGGGFAAPRGAPSRFNVSLLEPILNEAYERLNSVCIECLHFEKFINKYDHQSTLFFIDPPYWGFENDYGKNVFSKDDYNLLRSLLEACKSKFIMTINDITETRNLFKKFNMKTENVQYSNNRLLDNNRKELIITNF